MGRPPIERWDEMIGESDNGHTFGDDVVFDLIEYIKYLEKAVVRWDEATTKEPFRNGLQASRLLRAISSDLPAKDQ